MRPSCRVSLALSLVFVAAALASCGGGRSSKKPKQDPATQATTHYRLAQGQIKSGRILDALREADQAVALAPSNPEMANFRGQILLLAGRFPQAAQELERALELDPYLTDAHNNLGVVYDRLGRSSEAEEQYRTALRDPAYPSPQKVHMNLGILYAAQGKAEESIHELRKAVEIDPKYYQAHYELAGRLEAGGKLEAAAKEYEVAAPDYQSSGEYQYRLGFVYFRLKDKAKATEHLQKVVDISPGSENAARADELLKVLR